MEIFETNGWLLAIIIGIAAGWIAEQVTGRRHGILTNLIVGLLGALIGWWLVQDILQIPIDGIWSSPDGMDQVEQAWSAYADADPDAVSQHLAHLALHRALWQASGNSMLLRMWPVAESMSTLVLAQDQAVRRDPERALAVHAALIDAIRSRDPEALDAALAEHTRRSAEEFLTLRGD